MIGAIDMPELLLREVRAAVTDFQWGGKGVKSKAKASGLGCKKKSNESKNSKKKFLCDKVEYWWKEFFREFLDECGENGLFMRMKKHMTEMIPLYYQEVLSAWSDCEENVRD